MDGALVQYKAENHKNEQEGRSYHLGVKFITKWSKLTLFLTGELELDYGRA